MAKLMCPGCSTQNLEFHQMENIEPSGEKFMDAWYCCEVCGFCAEQDDYALLEKAEKRSRRAFEVATCAAFVFFVVAVIGWLR